MVGHMVVMLGYCPVTDRYICFCNVNCITCIAKYLVHIKLLNVSRVRSEGTMYIRLQLIYKKENQLYYLTY